MTIFQPRRDNVSTYEMTKGDLLQWAEKVLKPTAALAAKGEGEYKAGEHCRFCKIRNVCRKRAEYNLELARYDFAMPDTLEDEEIEAILDRSAELASWVSDVQAYALQAALRGKKWKGHKLVAGRSTRKYTDEKAVAEAVSGAGFDPYERKLKGITAMTSMLGKQKFEELLDGFVDKPPGRPTLVPDTDRRPELNVSTAQEDFDD